MSKPSYSVSAAGAIFNKNKTEVLLIKRADNGHWEPPGGVVEIHESLEAAVRREIKEETGAHSDVVRLSGVYKNIVKHVVSIVFECELTEGISPRTPEASKVRWHSIENIHKLMSPAYAIRIQDALDGGGKTAAHDGHSLLRDV